MEHFFKLRENNTDVKTELFAGLTTFLTMAYIMFVNPSILSLAGMDKNAVFIATILAAVIGTLIMGLVANVPFAQAPGMGLNAFFTFTIVFRMGFTWQQALAMVFICGLINILITVTKLRKAIINAIPVSLQYAISGGIGLFIAYIGLINSGFLTFLVEEPHKITDGLYNATVPAVTDFANKGALLALFGLIVTIILLLRNVKGAILIGIIATTIASLATGHVSLAGGVINSDANLGALSNTFMKMDLAGLFADPGKFLLIFSTIFAFSLTDTFDTIGTFLGTGRKAGIFDDKDSEKFEKNEGGFNSKLEKALFADATATSIGAILGTSNTTTYVESAAGISVGGKTGLTSVTTAVLFLASLLLLPLVGVVPAVATSPALIVVGILMAEGIKNIDWEDLEVAIPAFFTLAMMPLGYSITTGVSWGFIFYVITKVVKGKAREVHPIMYIVSGLFILSMLLTATVK
ncbi:NCS2 family permease [Proteiniclasticum sp. QWL-01]|uniref:NCS2 family permease n=1 Tax=Proteiniclasticum sp. QWL-01 TaxID=3036945 RepID=UPI00220A9883|nr:NCS2 family permease [Proteiniclasticum sp. QWL-01]UUM11392.1 NCS2 family permease [Clostridiaceae bacterium HFYG-1003]WFF72796.1 NCS2 family permease [Proteiniclasticum sp. QWL-01]